ncbi:hypothetical protein E2C01_050211 [Portunus trituberculatus]|uniref:Uncharacterized protein n=1 Tax=Portunus trituberculatus TaxID=210409 RepID=A0A5B7GGP6_PORTR|nr:hypothetical protein [Portunus trituberculatus]
MRVAILTCLNNHCSGAGQDTQPRRPPCRLPAQGPLPTTSLSLPAITLRRASPRLLTTHGYTDHDEAVKE